MPLHARYVDTKMRHKYTTTNSDQVYNSPSHCAMTCTLARPGTSQLKQQLSLLPMLGREVGMWAGCSCSTQMNSVATQIIPTKTWIAACCTSTYCSPHWSCTLLSKGKSAGHTGQNPLTRIFSPYVQSSSCMNQFFVRWGVLRWPAISRLPQPNQNHYTAKTQSFSDLVWIAWKMERAILRPSCIRRTLHTLSLHNQHEYTHRSSCAFAYQLASIHKFTKDCVNLSAKWHAASSTLHDELTVQHVHAFWKGHFIWQAAKLTSIRNAASSAFTWWARWPHPRRSCSWTHQRSSGSQSVRLLGSGFHSAKHSRSHVGFQIGATWEYHTGPPHCSGKLICCPMCVHQQPMNGCMHVLCALTHTCT